VPHPAIFPWGSQWRGLLRGRKKHSFLGGRRQPTVAPENLLKGRFTQAPKELSMIKLGSRDRQSCWVSQIALIPNGHRPQPKSLNPSPGRARNHILRKSFKRVTKSHCYPNPTGQVMRIMVLFTCYLFKTTRFLCTLKSARRETLRYICRSVSGAISDTGAPIHWQYPS
jgi:hypothetical protein